MSICYCPVHVYCTIRGIVVGVGWQKLRSCNSSLFPLYISLSENFWLLKIFLPETTIFGAGNDPLWGSLEEVFFKFWALMISLVGICCCLLENCSFLVTPTFFTTCMTPLLQCTLVHSNHVTSIAGIIILSQHCAFHEQRMCTFFRVASVKSFASTACHHS